MKDYIVYSLRLANYLVNNDFKIKSTSINVNYPKYKIFYFEQTDELLAAIEKFKQKISS